jgi:hypothetical protein
MQERDDPTHEARTLGCDELGPDSRRLLRAARGRGGPSEGDRARVWHALRRRFPYGLERRWWVLLLALFVALVVVEQLDGCVTPAGRFGARAAIAEVLDAGRVGVLCKVGHYHAKAAARRFLAEHPASAHATAIQAVCGVP